MMTLISDAYLNVVVVSPQVVITLHLKHQGNYACPCLPGWPVQVCTWQAWKEFLQV